MRPFTLKLERSAPSLVRALQLLETLVFALNTLSGVLAAVPYSLATYVAVCVSVSTTISSVVEYHQLPRLVPATNAALRDVHNLLTWWASLSMVDRRTRAAKHHAVSTLERAAFSLVTAVTLEAKGTDGGGESVAEREEDKAS